MGYLFGTPTGASGGGGGGGGFVGSYLEAAVPAGNTDGFNPGGGFPGTTSAPVGRLDLDPSAGNATLLGMVAGLDGQVLIVRNIDAANTLAFADASSANPGESFAVGGGFDLTLTPGQSCQMVYYAGTVNAWVVTP